MRNCSKKTSKNFRVNFKKSIEYIYSLEVGNHYCRYYDENQVVQHYDILKVCLNQNMNEIGIILNIYKKK
jgi:hypothetical protein